jgi:hypothetical protein
VPRLLTKKLSLGWLFDFSGRAESTDYQ